MLTGKMGVQLILPITMFIKRIKGVSRKHYGASEGVGLNRA